VLKKINCASNEPQIDRNHARRVVYPKCAENPVGFAKIIHEIANHLCYYIKIHLSMIIIDTLSAISSSSVSQQQQQQQATATRLKIQTKSERIKCDFPT
jgi:hypothetical protein